MFLLNMLRFDKAKCYEPAYASEDDVKHALRSSTAEPGREQLAMARTHGNVSNLSNTAGHDELVSKFCPLQVYNCQEDSRVIQAKIWPC